MIVSATDFIMFFYLCL